MPTRKDELPRVGRGHAFASDGRAKLCINCGIARRDELASHPCPNPDPYDYEECGYAD